MKKINLVVAIVLLFVGGLIFFCNQTPKDVPSTEVVPTGEVVTVIMKDEGFFPSEFTISIGTTITWINEGKNPHWPASNFHPTHGIYPEFDPLEGIPPGEEWSVVLKPGRWNFHDHLYPDLVGTIIVEKK